MKNSRKPVMFGFFTIGAFLALASIAYACTTFKGQMVVTPASPGSGSVTAVGNNRGMGWCSPITGRATIPTGTSTLNIDIAPSTGPCASQLPDRTDYAVNWVNNEAMTRNPDRWLIDCMSPISLHDGALGVKNVKSGISVVNGKANVNVNVTAKTANTLGESAVCFGDPKGYWGNQAPVTVI